MKDRLKVFMTTASILDSGSREHYARVRQALLDNGVELVFDWLVEPQTSSPAELFKKTIDAMESSDLVVADMSFPSTGVGQQISLAVSKKIPVLVLKAEWSGTSEYTIGSESELLRYVQYGKDNLKKILQNNLKVFGKERFVKFNVISTPEINSVLEKESERLGISRSQLLRRIVRSWLAKSKGDS